MVKIIDYRAGNAPSVKHAVTHLGFSAAFASKPEDIKGATHIILPGVGSAGATMESLREMNLINVLYEAVNYNNIFFLGVCVGLQILFSHSEEENTPCLGWIEGNVKKFDNTRVRVPQMGWNNVNFKPDIDSGLKDNYNGYYYFVNSYYADPKNSNDIWGLSDYNGPFTSAVHHKNIYATQFHIEKSGKAGLVLLKKFLEL